MKFAPMLAQSAQPHSFETYLSDDRWIAEQKLDGQRLLLKVENGQVMAANRSGDTTTVDRVISAPFAAMTGNWCFDGEFLDGKFWIFDVPYALDLIAPDSPYTERRKGLEAIFKAAWLDEPRLRLIDVARTETEKRSLMDWCRSHEAEGVMFKNVNGVYLPGKRSHDMMKAKFVETADVVIIEIGREGKSSVAVGMFTPGDLTLTEVGSIKMTEGNLARAQLGDVIAVKYLYCTRDLRLYQARFESFRLDKEPQECLLDGNLRMVNKEVRTSAK